MDEAWQRQACELLGIRFVRPFQRQEGGSDMILTRPDMRSLRSIGGDGNCLFRALCYIISGSEAQHGELRSAIVAHMRSTPFLVSGTGPDGNRNYLVTSVLMTTWLEVIWLKMEYGVEILRCAFLHICWMLQYIPTRQTPTTGCVAFLMPLTEGFQKMSTCLRCIFS